MYRKVAVYMLAMHLFAGSSAYTGPSTSAEPKPIAPPARIVFEFDVEGQKADVDRFIKDSRIPPKCKVKSQTTKSDPTHGPIASVYYLCSPAKTTAVRKEIIDAIQKVLGSIKTTAVGTIIIRVRKEDCQPQQCGEGSFNKLYLIDDPCVTCVLE